MPSTIDTQYGKVIASTPYYSFTKWEDVISLTLIKPENQDNGYGVSKEFRESELKLNRKFIDSFAKEASLLL